MTTVMKRIISKYSKTIDNFNELEEALLLAFLSRLSFLLIELLEISGICPILGR